MHSKYFFFTLCSRLRAASIFFGFWSWVVATIGWCVWGGIKKIILLNIHYIKSPIHNLLIKVQIFLEYPQKMTKSHSWFDVYQVKFKSTGNFCHIFKAFSIVRNHNKYFVILWHSDLMQWNGHKSLQARFFLVSLISFQS